MNPELNTALKERIIHYLGETQQTMWTFARKAGVPLALVDKLCKGEEVLCRYRTASKILFIVDPQHARAVIQEFMETMNVMGIHDEDPVNNQQILDKVLGKVLISRVNYIVHSFCSTQLGSTRAQIEEALGNQGMASLAFLLKEGVLVERDDGIICDPLFETLQSDENQLAQMIRYNLDTFEPDHIHSGIMNHVDGYSEKGLKNLTKIARKARLEISELNSDPSNFGQNPAFFSLVVGKVAPWLDKGGPNPTFRKSYDMDHETAEIVSNIAHDMRGPFRQVMEFVNAHSDIPRGEIDSDRAKRAAKRVDLMIDSLRKLQSHEIVSRQMNVFCLDAILDFSRTVATESDKLFSYDGVREILGYLDDEKVERLVQNLIINAFEAAKSEVVFVCYRDGDSLRLIVEDNGLGVPDAYVSRLFERGFTLGKRDGTGVGLYNVKAIAEGHDGEVFYERMGGITRFSAILRNVFSSSQLEGDIGEDFVESDFSLKEGTKLLFLRIACADSLYEGIRSSLSEYDFTSNVDDLSYVRLVCTDEPEIAFEASQLDDVRVWLIPKGMVEKKEFIPALKNLANQVYGVRSQV